MITLEFDNILQSKIFFLLTNNPKGLIRKTINERLNTPRTTIYDNIKKLMNKNINNIPYIKYRDYRQYVHLPSRPLRIFYVPQGLIKELISIEFTCEIKN